MAMADLSKANSHEEYIQYNKDVLHKHSPGIQKLLDLASDYVLGAEKTYREQGTGFAWSGGASESPLFYASGVVPVGTLELMRVGSPNALSAAEDFFHIPRSSCGMIKVFLGELYLRRNETSKRIFYQSGVCDPMSMAYEMLRHHGYDVYAFDGVQKYHSVTPERYQEIKSYYMQEMRNVAQWLSGRPLDEDKLKAELVRYNRIGVKAREITALRVKHPTYLRAMASLYVLIGLGNYFGQPEAFEAVLDEILDEISALKDGEYNEPVVKLLWAGSRRQEFDIYETINNAGAEIIGWCIPNAYKSIFDESSPPLEAFVETLLGGNYYSDIEKMCEFYVSQFKQSGAEAMISYGWSGCAFTGTTPEIISDYFRSRQIPYFKFEDSFHTGPADSRLVTQINSIAELLRQNSL